MTKNENTLLDIDGHVLREGDTAILLSAPDELLSNLPSEDQEAIKDQVGKTMLVHGFDEYGHVELEFKSADETIHFIWVKPVFLRAIGSMG